ncbi:exported protein of unknown function [Burkholderia multivorans]
MRGGKYFVMLLCFAFLFPCSSFSQGIGSIPFASAAPIKVSFPVPGSIILFFNSPRCESCNQGLEVYALTPNGNMFERIYIGVLDTDGDPPDVESIFLENIGEKSKGDLFLLVSWKSGHLGAGIYTKNYAVYVFSREQDGKKGLKRLVDIENKIGQTSEGSVEGENGRPEKVSAKYKNAGDVRKILRGLGY